ncbi:hypothetical protein MPSEU_000036800 [Mayamaea pseudoterrestris]|nr:hypothetical protein MPSEU_000036800 [Mayamaea pseudoterrestris]
MSLRKNKTDLQHETPSKKTKKHATSRRRQPLLPASTPDNDAIHVLQNLEATMLCTNRLLREQGLSRMIVGYYKDLLAIRIDERLDLIGETFDAMTGSRVTRRVNGLFQELNEYMQYYSMNTMLMKKLFSVLKTAAHDKSMLRPAMAEAVLARVVLTATQHSSYVLAVPLVILLTNLLYPHEHQNNFHLNASGTNITNFGHLPLHTVDVDWKNAAVNVIVDARGCKDLILATADLERSGEISIIGCERLVSFLSSNLSRRSSLKHNLLAMDFVVAQLQFNAMRMQAILQQPLFFQG